MKMAVFWDVAPWTLIDTASIIRVMKRLSVSTRLHDATSRKTAIFILCCENLKSHKLFSCLNDNDFISVITSGPTRDIT
jgi:hypothetical protein